MIFLLIWLGMAIMADCDMRHILGSLGMVVAMMPFAIVAIITDYQRERISLFLDPNKDSMGSGFNILQAEISVGSGGWFGRCLTNGTGRNSTTSHADYGLRIQILGEELGFVGALILFALFILLLMRGLRAAT